MTRELVEYENASEAARAVYEDIMRTRGADDVNNFWKALAHDPASLARTWEAVKTVMAPGALDPLTKQLVYIAVSITNGCEYCMVSHGAAARADGMDEAMFAELVSVVALANQTNRQAVAYGVPVDEAFRDG